METSKLKLQDFCDLQALYNILDNWAKGTGLSAVIVDNEGNLASQSFGMSPYCELIQSIPEGKERCKDNWKDKNYGIHECHAGFYDFAIPLTLPDGTELGKILAGQMFIDEQDPKKILKKIKDLNIPQEKLESVLSNIPKKTLSEMEGSYQLLKQMIDFFIKNSYDTFQEKQASRNDVLMLSAAVKTVYRISMNFNITKNEYHVIDHDYGVTNIVPVNGTIDQIVEIGVKSIPVPEQAQQYYDLFNRQALIAAHISGIKELSLQHQQTTYNGEVHWMEGRLVFVEQNDGDIHAICLSRIIDDDIENKLILKEALDKSKQQQNLLQEALDNYKQADYDRRRDFLTGLRNRQDMFDLFNDALSGKRKKIKSMFMMDIDNFKNLNDRYGHSYGDECLKKIGDALKEYGDENNMYFYRYGGEELLGISFDSNKSERIIAHELVKLVSDLNIKRDDSPFGVVTISLGYTKNNSRYEKMIDKADKAMYFAKKKGKNQAVCYEDKR